MKYLFFILLLALETASAFSGKVTKQVFVAPSLNWKTESPTVVFALGALSLKQREMYSHYGETLKDELKVLNLKIKVLEEASGIQIVAALRDKNTVGFIWVGHSYLVPKIKSAVLVDARGWPLPSGFLSAATPALQFVALLGCHGKQVLNHYQVEYEFSRLPGTQTEFHTTDRLLATGLLNIDGVKNALDYLIKDIKKIDFAKNTVQAESSSGFLEIKAQDVVPGIEPRFAYYNGFIVGTLEEAPGIEGDMQVFKFNLYSWQKSNLKCLANLSIMSSELTNGVPVDDYLVRSARVEFLNKTFSAQITAPLHIGDDSAPPSFSDSEAQALTDRVQELMKSYKGPSSDGALEFTTQLNLLLKLKEWSSQEPSIWSEHPQRIFSKCLTE